MTGRTSTLNDSTVCSIERALFDTPLIYLFIFIEGNAVSVMNLNYSTCMISFTLKIVKKTDLKKIFFWKKTFFENTFLLKKKIFFGKIVYLWCLTVPALTSRGLIGST